MADRRYKNGVWRGNPISAAQVMLQQANDPIQHGWHWVEAKKAYRLDYAGMTAWLRRPTLEERQEFNLTSLNWLVGIGDKVYKYSGWVDAFTPEVRKDLCAAAVVRASQPDPEWADDYGLEERSL